MREKWWVIIPVIYILSPADLIPEPVLGFGIVDDLVILGFLLTIVLSFIGFLIYLPAELLEIIIIFKVIEIIKTKQTENSSALNQV